MVKEQLENAHSGLEVSIKKIKTQGDKILDVALSKIGDKGLFVKELENALLDESADLAVHSMKDMMTTLPPGLEIAVTSEREDVRDVLCLSKHASDDKKAWQNIKTIGTSSLRRVAQLKRLYPNIDFVDIRGNLNTRFKKLDDPKNGLDGIILAAAGVKRMGWGDRISVYLDPQEVLPAVGQGALAIEIKSSRDDVKKLINSLNSPQNELIVKGERSYLRTLEGGCQVPVGIYSQIIDESISIVTIKYTGIVANLDGSKYLREEIIGELKDSEELGEKLAYKLLDQGAKEILDSLRT